LKDVRVLLLIIYDIEPPEGFVSEIGAPDNSGGQNEVDDKVNNIENKA
jgi:hypothetical protein